MSIQSSNSTGRGRSAPDDEIDDEYDDDLDDYLLKKSNLYQLIIDMSDVISDPATDEDDRVRAIEHILDVARIIEALSCGKIP